MANGQGHIRQRSNGSWTLTIYLGKDARGKPKQMTRTVRGTKKEAQRELARLVVERDRGVDINPERLTVAELSQRWLKATMPALAASTAVSYDGLLRNHILPVIGTTRLYALKPLHIEAVKAGVTKGGRSAKLALNTYRELMALLAQAVKWQLISINPCASVNAPRPKRFEAFVPNEDELQRLFEAGRHCLRDARARRRVDRRTPRRAVAPAVAGRRLAGTTPGGAGHEDRRQPAHGGSRVGGSGAVVAAPHRGAREAPAARPGRDLRRRGRAGFHQRCRRCRRCQRHPTHVAPHRPRRQRRPRPLPRPSPRVGDISTRRGRADNRRRSAPGSHPSEHDDGRVWTHVTGHGARSGGGARTADGQQMVNAQGVRR